jgi:hypothetical protein
MRAIAELIMDSHLSRIASMEHYHLTRGVEFRRIPQQRQTPGETNLTYVGHLFEVASTSHVSTIVSDLAVQRVLLPRILSRCGCTATVKVEST